MKILDFFQEMLQDSNHNDEALYFANKFQIPDDKLDEDLVELRYSPLLIYLRKKEEIEYNVT